MMQLEIFINFNGNCREAAAFYAKAFKTEVHNLMTYAEAPQDPSYPLSEEDKNRVMYAGIDFGNMVVMMMDVSEGFPFIEGNNITPTISIDDKEEIKRIFGELSEGGKVVHELSQTFFSELYGMVTDKFGIGWQVLYYQTDANK